MGDGGQGGECKHCLYIRNKIIFGCSPVPLTFFGSGFIDYFLFYRTVNFPTCHWVGQRSQPFLTSSRPQSRGGWAVVCECQAVPPDSQTEAGQSQAGSTGPNFKRASGNTILPQSITVLTDILSPVNTCLVFGLKFYVFEVAFRRAILNNVFTKENMFITCKRIFTWH